MTNKLSKTKIPCSVGILTLNSGAVLARCLESVKDFSEIIICDGNSTDKTLEIAKKYGCKIIKQYDTDEPNQKIKDFSEVRNKCLQATSFDWFFYIDSDEVASPQLVEEIREVINKNPKETLVYFVPGKYVMNGKVIKYSTTYPGYEERFFNKRSGARFVKPVHEKIIYDKDKYKLGKLKNPRYGFLSQERINNQWRHVQKYLKMEKELNRNSPFLTYLKWVLIIRVAKTVKLILVTPMMYILHGFKETAPVKIEIAKILYNLKIIYYLTLNQLEKLYKK